MITIEQFAKMREWIMKGNSCHVFNSECGLIMWLLRTSGCYCEYACVDNECSVIFPHVGL